MEFSAKNRFHHATASVQNLLNDFTNISVISNLKKKQPSENEYWGFANCIPRVVILHEVIQEDKSMIYACPDQKSANVLFNIYNFNNFKPTDWEPSQLRHALETKVSIYIIDAKVSNEDAELVADLIRGCYC